MTIAGWSRMWFLINIKYYYYYYLKELIKYLNKFKIVIFTITITTAINKLYNINFIYKIKRIKEYIYYYYIKRRKY
jgi:predicted transcriptional regulator